MNHTVIGIDVGGTTTKIVGFRKNEKGERALILIGPEGDFSREEVAAAVAAGFEEITLGTQRLRTETAAVVAVTMVSVVNNR